MIDDQQIKKDALWELDQARKSVDEHREKLKSISSTLGTVSQSLSNGLYRQEKLAEEEFVPFKKDLYLPTFPPDEDLRQAIDQLDQARERLARASQEAKRLGIG